MTPAARRPYGPGVEPNGRTICVLGMHRSGTSCLAGTLEQAGVFLGEVATYSKFNLKGNRESDVFRGLNGRVLADNGAEWNRPPAQPPVWSDQRRVELDGIIQGYAGRAVWGFKDPRTTLTLEGWLDALPRLECVGTVRHPLAVARSLKARPRGPELAEGVRLWTAYNARLWKWYCRIGFPIVSFDADAERLGATLREVTRRLDLPGESPDAAPFFDPELRHQAESADDNGDAALLTDEVRRLYERLTAAAIKL